MTPENLSRAFASLGSHGVTVRGPTVSIARLDALERLAQPNPLIDNHMPPQDRIVSQGERERWASEVARSTGYAH